MIWLWETLTELLAAIARSDSSWLPFLGFILAMALALVMVRLL